MAGKRFSAEQIIMKLREAEVGLAQGQRVGQVSKQMGVSEQTYYRWRKEYGGLRLDQAKSVSSEITLGEDTANLDRLRPLLWQLAETVARRMKKAGIVGLYVFSENGAFGVPS